MTHQHLVDDIDQSYSATDIPAVIRKMAELKEMYNQNRSVFIAGAHMRELLKGLDASDADLDAIQRVSDDLPGDPTLPFRQSKNGRFCYDLDNKVIFRGEFQPFVLSAEEDFVRHDSGQARRFAEIGNDLQLNSALHALLRFNAFMVQGLSIAPRTGLDYTSNRWVCTLFNLRTITTPQLVGEPALEGVHSDGVDHTMTTLIGSENLRDGSAVTFIHDMREKNATRCDQADPNLIINRYQHRHFLDTVLIADHERKHSLSPVVAADPQQRSTRDMLIFFTRKPAAAGHVSYPYDSLQRHTALPLCIDVAPPGRK